LFIFDQFKPPRKRDWYLFNYTGLHAEYIASGHAVVLINKLGAKCIKHGSNFWACCLTRITRFLTAMGTNAKEKKNMIKHITQGKQGWFLSALA